MKRRLIALLLISVFVIKVNNLSAQDQLDSDSVELRKIKISTSKILNGLAIACVYVAKIMGAKTHEEKQECKYEIASSVLQVAANAYEEHKQHKQHKQNQKANAQAATTNKSTAQEQDAELLESSETKSINFEYLEQIQDLKTEQEQIDMINNILEDKESTENLIDQINAATKLMLINALFDN